MPDEINSHDLEKLFDEAKQTSQTPITDHPKPCSHATELLLASKETAATVQKCPTCLWSFCPQCASLLDPRYCKLCMSEESTELCSNPLIDTDGVQHDGRILTPSPVARNDGFFSPRIEVKGVTLAKIISEMSDSELKDFITYYKNLVQQAERTLDFRRVVLGSAQLEGEQRRINARRKLQADKTNLPTHTASATADKSTGKPKKTPASTEQLANMMKAMEMLKQLRANREGKK